MRITKLGHCCLLIEIKGKRILTDPGSYTVDAHSKLRDLDYILITHEHEDHYHVASIKALIKENPNVKIYSNISVGTLMDAEGIAHTVMSHGEHTHLGGLGGSAGSDSDIASETDADGYVADETDVEMHKKEDSILLEGIGERHALMHGSIPQGQNMGFFIENKLWYPGDAYTNPQREVEICALPVSGPWVKIGDAIDYALMIKPKICFPVHDGLRWGTSHRLPGIILPQNGIEFVPMVEGDVREF